MFQPRDIVRDAEPALRKCQPLLRVNCVGSKYTYYTEVVLCENIAQKNVFNYVVEKLEVHHMLCSKLTDLLWNTSQQTQNIYTMLVQRRRRWASVE